VAGRSRRGGCAGGVRRITLVTLFGKRIVFSIPSLRELYTHMEWADARVWQVVAEAPGTARDAELRERLFHIHRAQQAYLDLWTGRTPPRVTADRFQTLSDLRSWARPYYRDVMGFLDALDASRLREPLAIPWARLFRSQLGPRPDTTTLADVLLQIPLHGLHHRGQVGTRLKQLGVEPPLVDYIAWAWLGRPAPAWVD